jgi:hypothetical protein
LAFKHVICKKINKKSTNRLNKQLDIIFWYDKQKWKKKKHKQMKKRVLVLRLLVIF